jgi:hypothetical protein
MDVNSKESLKNLIKHRNKWQVKFIIPKDVRWAFDNKSTYKRSTGCDINDLEAAKAVRDKIVYKFKALVRAYRRGGKKELEALGARYNKDQLELKLALNRLNSDIMSENPVTTETSNINIIHNTENVADESAPLPKQGSASNNPIINSKHGPNVGTWINERLLDKSGELEILKQKIWLDEEQTGSAEEES